MGFKDAVATCLAQKYATFSGRASRSEYWWFYLFIILVLFALVLPIGLTLDTTTGEPSSIAMIFFGLVALFILAMVIPMIAVTVRRFHDRDMSGWWYLGFIVLGAVPFVGIAASIANLVIMCLKGTDGDNRFGPDPLRPTSRADIFA